MTETDLASLLASHAASSRVPGAVLDVLRDGVYTVATYGIEDERTAVPVTANSRFSAGSSDPDNPTVTFGALTPSAGHTCCT